MTKNNNDTILELNRICQKIRTETDCSKYVGDLRKRIQKGAFFEYYSFIELLEVLEKNQNIPKTNKSEIFKLLDFVLTEGSDDKNACINRLYNFLIKQRDRADLIGDFLPICNFETEPKTTKPETLFLVSEILTRVVQSDEHRKTLYRNFETHFINHSVDEELCTKLLQSIVRIVSNLGIEKKWNVIESFLKATLAKIPKLQLKNDEAHREMFNIFSFLSKYGHEQTNVMKICAKIAKDLSAAHTGANEKSCYKILSSTFTMCCDKFTEKDLKEMHTNHYINAKTFGSSTLHQKTASLIAKVLFLRSDHFEITPGCFTAYHYLIVGLFHVFKNIKNDEGLVACCTDVKRHEVHSLISSTFSFATKLLVQENFPASSAKNLLYHVSYDAQICSEFKCKSKGKETLNTYNRLYNVIYEFSTKKSMIPEAINYLQEFIKTLFKLWIAIPQEEKASSVEPDTLVWKIYENPKNKQVAAFSANGIAALMKHRKNAGDDGKILKKSLMKYAFSMRQATTVLGFSSAYEFRKSKEFKDVSFSGETEISLAESLHLEIGAVFRYNPAEDVEVIGKLFTELCGITKDPMLLAQSCQMITDATLKTMNIENFKKMTKILEQANKKFDLEMSLALALNNYSLYFIMFETTTNELKEDEKKAMEKLDLEKELEHLKYLNESLRHFTDVVCHVMQCKDDLDKILSMKRVMTILNNMAVQYYIRGIKYKEMETFTLLWHLSQVEENAQVLLNAGTFFLDNHQLMVDASGNYIRVSKKVKPLTIDDILAKLNKLVDDDCIPNFATQTEPTQCFIASYLLSLWVYYVSTGRKSNGLKRWRQFKSLWATVKISENSANYETIRSKIYFCLVEINMNCCNRSADNFLSIASGILMNIKTIDRDFSYQFYQIYHRITFKAINYSMNRLSDMNHYDVVITSLIFMASRKGYCLKVLELLSLSILRNLNMEKIDNAKSQLKEITKLIGLKEEILIETPTKFEAPVTMFDYEIQGVRKAAVAPASPIQCELSMIHEDHSMEMSRQLQTFVHEASCKCEICKIPQLKFIMFQIGCHYSRLLWMINKSDVSMKFNDFAFEPWQNVCDKLRRVKDCEFLMINKIDFAVFSIRWLFQSADTMISLSNFEEVEEIYKEVELICKDSVPDFECFKQALHCRKVNLEFLLEHGLIEDKEASKTELSFAEFFKIKMEVKKPKKPSKSPVPIALIKRPLPTLNIVPPKKDDVVYIDLSDESSSTAAKKAKKTTSKVLTIEPPSTSKTAAKPHPTPKSSTSVVDLTKDTPATTRTRPTRVRRMI